MDKPCFIYSSLVGGFRVVSVFWLIYAILLLISMPKYLCGHVFIFLGYIHLTVNSLGHMITLMFVRGTTRLVFTSLLPFHIPTSNDVEHLFKNLPVMPISSLGEMAIQNLCIILSWVINTVEFMYLYIIINVPYQM